MSQEPTNKIIKHPISPILFYSAIILIIALGIIMCMYYSSGGIQKDSESSDSTSSTSVTTEKTDLEQIDDLIDSVDESDFSQELIDDSSLGI
ncbi:hypothetical protein ACFL14_00970 [Patescibacteria group bacterium]